MPVKKDERKETRFALRISNRELAILERYAYKQKKTISSIARELFINQVIELESKDLNYGDFLKITRHYKGGDEVEVSKGLFLGTTFLDGEHYYLIETPEGNVELGEEFVYYDKISEDEYNKL